MIRLPLAFGRSIWLLILFTTLSMSFVACGIADPSLNASAGSNLGAAPSGKILFVSDGRVTLWDGKTRQVTENGADANPPWRAMSPAWAADGQRFAYARVYDEGYSDIIVADANGATLKQVTNNRPNAAPYSAEFACYAYWAIDPVWSPAGEQLLWVSDRGGWEFDTCANRLSDPMFLWFSETWAADPYQLQSSVDIGQPQESPTISPDGNQVAFVVRADITATRRVTQIEVMDLNGGSRRTLVTGNEAAYDPVWSPVGDNIAFVQRSGTQNDVWIVPARNGTPYQLTNVGSAVSPVWSPDGRYLAFFRENKGQFEAWFVEVSAGADGRLTASEPQQLFSASNIDSVSGMSWAAN